MDETAEPLTIKWMTGVSWIKPVEYVATWRTHDLFDMTGGVVSFSDCDDLFLAVAYGQGMRIKFANERPAAPKRGWLKRFFAP